MVQNFGNFVDIDAGMGEYLKIGFHPGLIPLQQRWRNNGLSADFLAHYLSAFFPGDDMASTERQAQLRDAVSYIANELLENCMKYSYSDSQHLVIIEMFMESDSITLYTTNGIASESIADFQTYLNRLLTEDLDLLYLEQIERSAEDDIGAASGMGYLTMLNDYGVEIAWHFSDSDEFSSDTALTTMVRLPL